MIALQLLRATLPAEQFCFVDLLTSVFLMPLLCDAARATLSQTRHHSRTLGIVALLTPSMYENSVVNVCGTDDEEPI